MGRLIYEVMAGLCKGWPRRCDEYVEAVQLTTPDLCIPSGGTPFRILFGRDARTNLDALTPVLDGHSFFTGLNNFVAEKQQTFRELGGILERRKEENNRRRARHNAAIKRSSSDLQTRVGDRVLIKEAPSKLGRDGIHAKLVHEHWTGPWRIPSIEQPGLRYQATMSGRRIRGRVVAAANVKVFHERPEHLRHDVEDEFAHLGWGADVGLGSTSTMAVPLCTLTDRKALRDSERGWDGHHKDRYQSGAGSDGSRRRRSGTASHRCNWTFSSPYGRRTTTPAAGRGRSRHPRRGSETPSRVHGRYRTSQSVRRWGGLSKGPTE